MPMDAITTARPTLHLPEASDASEITLTINDWEVVRCLSGVSYPYQQADATDFIRRTMIDWSGENAFHFIIVSQSNIVGSIGLERQNQSTLVKR